ncbi:hypothetical protein ACFY5D_08100 [Paeniglutamicibacter sp. NPDC012692]|uniref:hypothetical protein n=1 Tax=Paeniglutamicibacter sp. NPDC012692 TaxID=3364388 RepID=UPI0036D09925
MTTIHAGVAAAAPAWDPPAGSAVPASALPAASGRILSRVTTLAAIALGLAHGWILVVFPHGLLLTMLLAAMVVACLKCAHRTWGNPQALPGLLVMSALMAIVHTFMALGIGGHQHAGHLSATVATSASGAMLAIAAAELALVMLCSIGMRRTSASGRGARYLV